MAKNHFFLVPYIEIVGQAKKKKKKLNMLKLLENHVETKLWAGA